MQRTAFALIVVVLILSLAAPSVCAEQRYGHEYFEYYVRDGGIEICCYLGKEEVVNVPQFIAGLPV